MWYVDFILALQSLQFSFGSHDEQRRNAWIRLASSFGLCFSINIIFIDTENACACCRVGSVVHFFFSATASCGLSPNPVGS